MLFSKQKKTQAAKSNRVLITVNVLGSAGPLRFIVNEEELVVDVIDMALKSYAREGRLPVLDSDLDDFLLYCPAARSDAVLSPWESIGAYGVRNFTLCKKPQPDGPTSPARPARENDSLPSRKGSQRWKAWLQVSQLLSRISLNKNS